MINLISRRTFKYLLLATLLFAAVSVSAETLIPTNSAAPDATTTIEIKNDVQLTAPKRFGINIGSRDQFGAAQYIKNIVPNPGFEAGEYNMVFLADSGATSNRVQADNWQTIWNNDTQGIGQPVNFWTGGNFEIVYGAGKWRAGTITNFTHDDGKYTFYLDGSGPAPAAGDVIFVRQNLGGFNWDVNTYNKGEPNDKRPNSPGAQSLRLLPADQAWRSSYSIGLDSYHRDGDSGAGKLFVVDGNWHFEIWAKADSAGDTLEIEFRRVGENTFFKETIPLTNEWQHIVRDFNVPDGTDVLFPWSPTVAKNALALELRTSPTSGDILIDDIILQRASTTNTVFDDTFVQYLKDYQPGIIRNWGAQLGSSLDNQLATPFARKDTGFNPNFRVPKLHHYSIHEFLMLSQEVGAEPWYVMPPTWSVAEIKNFAAYLGAEVGTHPYADLRASLGQSTPWTQVFGKIHLEYGNEIWGTNLGGQYPDPFIGATMRGGQRAGQIAHDRIGAFKESAYFNEPTYNFVLGGQVNFPARQTELEQGSSNHNAIGLAPYYAHLNSYGNDNEQFYPLYAHAQQTTSNSVVTQSKANIDAAAQGTGIAIYELNLHAIYKAGSDTAPLGVRNRFLSGIGGGISLPLTMQHYQQDMGVRDILGFRAMQFSKEMSNGEYARIWGMLRDLQATGRKRPTWLGVEIVNKAIRGDLVTTVQSGTPVHTQAPLNGNADTQNVPLIQSFAYKDGSSYGLVIYNLDLYSQQDVQITLAEQASNNATLYSLTANDVGDSNEDSELVKITTTPITNFGQGYAITLQPHSIYVLEWGSTGGTVNFPPVAVVDNFGTTLDTAINGNVLSNDTDANGDALSAVLVGGTASGTLNLNSDGSFTYTPNSGFLGADSFTYKASDGVNDSAEITVHIFVFDPNGPRVYLPIIVR